MTTPSSQQSFAARREICVSLCGKKMFWIDFDVMVDTGAGLAKGKGQKSKRKLKKAMIEHLLKAKTGCMLFRIMIISTKGQYTVKNSKAKAEVLKVAAF